MTADRAGEDPRDALPDGGERIVHRMGDLGYFDARRPAVVLRPQVAARGHRDAATLCTEQVEPVFNTHPECGAPRWSASARAARRRRCCAWNCARASRAREHDASPTNCAHIGEGFVHTAKVETFLLHPGFPVDIRHNAKIGREKLALWATARTAKR